MQAVPANIESVVQSVQDAARAIHTNLGPHMTEMVYESCLCQELTERKLSVVRLKSLPFFYKDVRLDDVNLRSLMFVQDSVLLEVSNFESGSIDQILADMAYCHKTVGLVVNLSRAEFSDVVRRYNSSDVIEPAQVRH